jgi:hypothetical protein
VMKPMKIGGAKGLAQYGVFCRSTKIYFGRNQ